MRAQSPGIAMRFRRCRECGSYAIVLLKIRGVVRPLCFNCLERESGRKAYRGYICSIVSCDSAPRSLVVLDEGGWKSLLVCEEHFKEIEPEVKAFISIPEWFTNGEEIILDEEGITFEMDVISRSDGNTSKGGS
jgi:hypothetical protein